MVVRKDIAVLRNNHAGARPVRDILRENAVSLHRLRGYLHHAGAHFLRNLRNTHCIAVCCSGAGAGAAAILHRFIYHRAGRPFDERGTQHTAANARQCAYQHQRNSGQRLFCPRTFFLRRLSGLFRPIQ